MCSVFFMVFLCKVSPLVWRWGEWQRILSPHKSRGTHTQTMKINECQRLLCNDFWIKTRTETLQAPVSIEKNPEERCCNDALKPRKPPCCQSCGSEIRLFSTGMLSWPGNARLPLQATVCVETHRHSVELVCYVRGHIWQIASAWA